MKNFIAFFWLLIPVLGFSQDKNSYNIGILVDKQSSELAPLLGALQNEIRAVVGEDAIITFPVESRLSNDFNLENARIHYETLINNDTDLIIAFGPINNTVISGQTTHLKPTILFGAVNKDFGYIEDNRQTSGIPNFSYMVASGSFNKDLSDLKELSDFNTVGIAVEAPLLDALPFKEIFDRQAAVMDVNYKMIPYNTADDIIEALDSNIDAFYLAGGFYLNKEEVQRLAARLIDLKIPSITTTGIEDVQDGLMATNQAEESISQFFRRIALNVEAFVNGEDLSQLPVYIQSDDKLTINYNTAEYVGLPIKYSLIAKTNFVGEYVNVLSEKRYNLLTVMTDVINDNLSLQTSKKNIDLSQQDVKAARSSYLPDVTASATGVHIDPDLAEISNGQNPEFSTSGTIELNQVLFSESANANIGIQKQLLKAQEADYNTDELDAIFNASNAYFNALILKANVQIQQQNLDLTKKNLEIAEQNYEAGESGKSDVLRFTSELAQNSQAFVESVNQLEQAFFALNQILNNPINLEIDVDEAELGQGIYESYDYERLRDLIDDPKLREPFVEYLIIKAKENAPEIRSLDYNLMATKRSIKLNSSGRFLPTLALQGQYNRDFEQWGKGSIPEPLLNDNYNVGLNLSIPIFNQNLRNINRQEALIQQDQLNISRDNIELNIEANVNNAILNLINEIVNIEISKVSESSARESLDLTQVAYSSGAVNIVQLLDAQSNYLQAQLARANATYNYLIGSMQLERYIGHYFLLKTQAENQEFIQGFFNYIQIRD
jgi:outer membrane protein TolC